MQINYPLENLPAPGATLPVVDGVHWLRMPLPFALDHINLWLLEDGEGYTAVDTGIAMDAVKEHWKSALAALLNKPTPQTFAALGSPLKGRETLGAVRRVSERRLVRQIVTHFHPDHLGLAAWLESETGATLWMTQGEYQTAHLVAAGIAPFDMTTMLEFFRQHGLDATRHAGIEKRGNAYRRGVPAIPASFRRMIDGDIITVGKHDWRIIVGYGHAPEHASLYCATLGVLIAGDMLLPRISTNVSAYAADPSFDSLGLFLASLERFTALPADTLVLPSHGRPFRGLHTRVAELQAHHAARCADLLTACSAGPRSACELLTVLFGRPIDDPHQTMFAMGEAIAHLNHLQQERRLARTIEGGIIRYTSLN